MGICDLCKAPIPANDWYTARGLLRLYCSVDCRNTANSRDGAPIRSQEMKAHFAQGDVVPPMYLEDPAARRKHARRAAAMRGEAMRREVHAGTWHNPALDDEARAKLARPRKHNNNPALVSAMRRRHAGEGMDDLTEEERAAYHAYEQQRRQASAEERRSKERMWYARRKARQSSPTE